MYIKRRHVFVLCGFYFLGFFSFVFFNTASVQFTGLAQSFLSGGPQWGLKFNKGDGADGWSFLVTHLRGGKLIYDIAL